MFYREAGQFKTTYKADQAIFPIAQDRWFVIGLMVLAFVVVPFIGNEYWLRSVLTPFLIFSLAALGLNLLTGFAGQISLGTAGFMAVGAFAAYKLTTSMPWMNIIVVFILAGVTAALVGIAFGLPSLRIKGFYLAVTTLAAHFFIEWTLTHFGWFTNYSTSGVISAPDITMFGFNFESAESRYLLALSIVVVLTLVAKNLVRSGLGRAWMAIRDMDVAAEVIGIPMLKTKLLAFAISSFYCGVAGALWAFVYLGTVEPQAFDISRAFEVLFMVIIGGLGSIYGSFMGAAFIVLLPILITNIAFTFFGESVPAEVLTNSQLVIFGALIIFFLIVEPYGLARLWQVAKEKLRLWPFPH